MERPLLNEHMGEVVRIETDQQKHPHAPYIGRIIRYDRNFIRLNSYAINNAGTVLSLNVEDVRKYEDGSTNLEIILKKDIIASLRKIKIEE